MKPEASENRFTEIVSQASYSPAGLQPADGARLMLDFYRNEHAEGCRIENDDDMLSPSVGQLRSGRG
jgi:hypothetical protein